MIRTRLQGGTPFFPSMLNNGKVEVCLKEDVDKALADKDKMIALLKDKANYNEYAYKHKSEELADTCRFYEKELRHQKYKRCLAMSWWCSAELGMLISTWEFKIKHYKKWQKRWLELAEKFKEGV